MEDIKDGREEQREEEGKEGRQYFVSEFQEIGNRL